MERIFADICDLGLYFRELIYCLCTVITSGFTNHRALLALQLFAHLSVSFGVSKYLTVRANTEFFNTDINDHRQALYLDYGRLYLVSYHYKPSVTGATITQLCAVVVGNVSHSLTQPILWSLRRLPSLLIPG